MMYCDFIESKIKKYSLIISKDIITKRYYSKNYMIIDSVVYFVYDKIDIGLYSYEGLFIEINPLKEDRSYISASTSYVDRDYGFNDSDYYMNLGDLFFTTDDMTIYSKLKLKV